MLCYPMPCYAMLCYALLLLCFSQFHNLECMWTWESETLRTLLALVLIVIFVRLMEGLVRA